MAIQEKLYRLTCELERLAKEETFVLSKQAFDSLNTVLSQKDSVLKILNEYKETLEELRKVDPEFDHQHKTIKETLIKNTALLKSLVERTKQDIRDTQTAKSRLKNIKSTYADKSLIPVMPQGTNKAFKINSTA